MKRKTSRPWLKGCAEFPKKERGKGTSQEKEMV
jgi:hypothetical protein